MFNYLYRSTNNNIIINQTKYLLITPNMARKSGSLNLKGIFDTWSLFDWIFLSSLDEQGDPAPTLVMFVGEATDTDTGVVNAFVALVHSNYTSQKEKNNI